MRENWRSAQSVTLKSLAHGAASSAKSSAGVATWPESCLSTQSMRINIVVGSVSSGSSSAYSLYRFEIAQ
jgi:hypothetical protein